MNITINNSKKWYESKTLWINIATIGAGLLTGIAELLSTEQAITIMAVTNIILRVMTNSKLQK